MMWNIDGRNKNAITLFSPEFYELPEKQCPKPMTMDQRIRQALSYIVDSKWLSHERMVRLTDRQPPPSRDRNE